MANAISIRRSLLLNLVVVIVLLSGAILAITASGSRRTVRVLSGALISRAIDHTETRLRRFFDPAVRGLKIARSWGEAGLLDDPARTSQLLVPLMRESPQVSSLMVADSRGRELMLLRTGDRWRARETRSDEWGRTVR